MKEIVRQVYRIFSPAIPMMHIVILCVVVFLLSAKGITDESVVSWQGDMPRYLMNGVYFYDLIGDLPMANPFVHASRYFARYPALSLGHHPMLLGVVEIPFYWIFGISVFSGRLTVISFLLLAAIVWFLLIRIMYDTSIAFLSSLIFVTTPFIVEFSRIVMSEIPTLSLIVVSAYLFYRYCESEKTRYAFAFSLIFSLSIYAKHTAVFMIPVFLGYFVLKKGINKLFSKDVYITCAIISLLVTPLAAITFKYSQFNIADASKPLSEKLAIANLLYDIQVIWEDQLTVPVVLLCILSIVLTVRRKDTRSLFFFLWLICCYLLATYIGVNRPRDTIYWIPVFSLFAATTIDFSQSRPWKILMAAILITIIGYQYVLASRMEPAYTSGYEEAAKYIIENKKGKSVLYSSVEDTGYFIFFVRKYDPARNQIILRSDKLLATSKMYGVVKERITKREEIYENLRNYGVGYVVIEDIKSESQALEWLREEVKTEKFILRKEITVRSSVPRLNKVSLTIYEYKDYSPPKDGVMLEMDIPLMGHWIKIPFKELL
ncbi:MAG: glycosyltransferase family 39 protein [bacterium]|nr:glycosyltransferase family 39 protein [bacterium]